VCITIFEFIAGLIFIVGMKIKLWDYSTCWGNIKGIICPLYSFFWYLLSAAYYFLIHPRVCNWLYWFTNHIEFSFVVGFFYGVFTIDVCYSLKVMTKIRKFAKENQIVLHLESLQQHMRKINEEQKEKLHFWLTMKVEHSPLNENLRNFLLKHKTKA